MATPTKASAKAPAKPARKRPAVKKVGAPPKVAAPEAAKPAKPVAPAAADKAPRVDKAKKPKLVRDSFTIPKAEYAVLEALKDRATQAGTSVKKSEVLRAGIKALAGMPDAAFLAALGAVPAIKTGRPAKA